MLGGFVCGAGTDAAASGRMLAAGELRSVVADDVAVLIAARRMVVGEGGGWKEERRR
jgi:hypothetical protein